MERKSMKRAITSLLFFLLCPASLPAQTQKPLLLGLASISGGIETLYVTKKIGAFKRNGLDVDFLLLQGGSQALQVLLSGDIKLISGGGWHGGAESAFQRRGKLTRRHLHADHAVQPLCQRQDPRRETAEGRQDRHLPFWQLVGLRRALYGRSFGP